MYLLTRIRSPLYDVLRLRRRRRRAARGVDRQIGPHRVHVAAIRTHAGQATGRAMLDRSRSDRTGQSGLRNCAQRGRFLAVLFAGVDAEAMAALEAVDVLVRDPSASGAIEPVGITNASASNVRNKNASTNAITIDSTVSRTACDGGGRRRRRRLGRQLRIGVARLGFLGLGH